MDENNITEDNRPEYAKKRVFIPIITTVVFVVCLIFYSIHNCFYKSTDDAFVEGHIITVSPRIQGQVISLKIDDNMEVKKGDLLLEIDPNDYKARLNQSKSKLDEAKASFQFAKNETEKSNVEFNFAKDDYTRYSKMFEKGIASKQEYDLSKTKYETSKLNLESKKKRLDETESFVKRLEAEVEENNLNLSYTKIYALQDGLITNKSVEEGNFVQVGAPLFSIVPKQMWVVANYKETQIANMKKGQKVKIKIDAYPSKKFEGEIESIQMATGAKASLFPPENAVGSYVKIVQRVPVKIIFKEDISKYNIVPGMSCVPEVKIK